ncbi:E3 ubiquitin-protein ligase TRIM71-like [Mya arenaria]|uniref:E3 ubiquitin-protein ligase TRIM71-like n=1 Tax=Mya arenaria TaxID=6604 RepID=UPI0022E3CF4B|nr:E3 ubiquitin-protein ligase TRIM71-like [Mya arenaria]
MMELQGIDHSDDVDNSSADDTMYCSPCEKGGGHIAANSFCDNCDEYLCLSCVKVHRNMKVTQDHVVLSGDSMPYFHSPNKADGKKGLTGCTEQCPSHSNEIIKFFCSEHDSLNCRDCIVVGHQTCKIDYIPDIAEGFRQGKDFESLNTNIAKVDRDLENCDKLIETCLKTIEEEVAEELKQIREHRAEVVAYFDKREKELLAKVNDIKKINDENVQYFKKKCQVAKDQMNAIKSSLESHENNISQLFVVAKQSKRQLEEIRTTLDDINTNMSIQTSKFVKDHETTDLMMSLTALGTIEENKKMPLQKPTKKGFPFKKDSSAEILARQGKMFTPSWHSGITFLSDDKILVVDCGYGCSSVRLLNTKSNKVECQLKLAYFPWESCLVTPTKAAVTLPRQATIQFIEINGDELTIQGELKLDGDCRGVDYHDNMLYVCFKNAKKIEAMSLAGRIIHKVDNKSVGNYLFMGPLNVRIMKENSPCLFVVDRDSHTVVKFSLKLDVLAKYEDPILKFPHGLDVVGNGELAVCGRDTNNIVLLDTEAGTMETLLGTIDGLDKPLSVCFSRSQLKMFVGSQVNNHIKIFTFKAV